jgi:hypothetical protein
MNKKIRNNRKMYAIQCSGCNKIVLPLTRTEKREMEELAKAEDSVKKWALGKIKMFPDLAESVKTFKEDICLDIQSHVYHTLLFNNVRSVCKCEVSSYDIIKCRA